MRTAHSGPHTNPDAALSHCPLQLKLSVCATAAPVLTPVIVALPLLSKATYSSELLGGTSPGSWSPKLPLNVPPVCEPLTGVRSESAGPATPHPNESSTCVKAPVMCELTVRV